MKIKKLILLSVFCICFLPLSAQENKKISIAYPRNEIKLSVGGSLHDLKHLSSLFWGSYSLVYDYRLARKFWIGLNCVYSTNGMESYYWREYDTNGLGKEFVLTKRNYGFALSPEIKWSYLDNGRVMLYGALSMGYCWDTFHENHVWGQLTFFGLSCYLGKNKKFFIGGDIYSGGFKGILSSHVGYRF